MQQHAIPHNGTASVLLGNGDGTFQPAVATIRAARMPFQSRLPTSMEMANRPCGGNNAPTITAPMVRSACFLVTAMVHSNPPSAMVRADSSSFASIADVNGDGKPDLVVANQCADGNCSSGSIGVLLSNGDGTFQSAVTYNSGGIYSFSDGFADVNGDGKPDLLPRMSALTTLARTAGRRASWKWRWNFSTAVDYSSGGVLRLRNRSRRYEWRR